MKLLDLEIKNFRGIKHFAVKFDGRSHLFFGANGFGKSSIVDAIDFLLSARITRLSGDGAGEVRPDIHYAFLGTKSSEVMVAANVRFGDGVSKRLERWLDDMQTLRGDELSVQEVSLVKRLSEQSSCVVRRQDILRFIAIQPQKRAERMQALLDISAVEDWRQVFRRIAHSTATAAKLDMKAAKGLRKHFAEACGIPKFTTTAALKAINLKRQRLSLPSVAELSSESLISNATASKASLEAMKAYGSLERLEAWGSVVASALQSSKPSVATFRAAIAELPDYAARHLETRNLVILGQKLSDGEKCPLCETMWNPDLLAKKLREKLAASEAVEEISSRIVFSSKQGLQAMNEALQILDVATEVSAMLGMGDECVVFADVAAEIHGYWDATNIERRASRRALIDVFNREDLRDALASVGMTIKAVHQRPSDQNALIAELYQLSAELRMLEARERDSVAIAEAEKRALCIETHFLAARDEVLDKMYEQVTAHTDGLYRKLHPHDAATFTSRLKAEEAALNLSVRFHDEKHYAPHIVHSESHQDSLGLCMFLAVNDHVLANINSPIIIDDVVTSLDVDHRKTLARVLSENFRDRQLIITTHEATWAQQLKSLGTVAPKSGVTNISGWDFHSGMHFAPGSTPWQRVRALLTTGGVDAAAPRLRKELEAFYSEQCDALGTHVRFVMDGPGLTLSDLMQPAISDLKKSLKKAKLFAVKNKNESDAELLAGLASELESADTAARQDQWMLNPITHFTPGVSATPAELAEIIALHETLANAMLCEKCALPYQKLVMGSVLRCGCRSWLME